MHKLTHTTHTHVHTHTQVASGHRIEENLQQQLSEKRQQIVNLEHQISCYRDEIASLKGHLATSDEVRALYSGVPLQYEGPWISQ